MTRNIYVQFCSLHDNSMAKLWFMAFYWPGLIHAYNIASQAVL